MNVQEQSNWKRWLLGVLAMCWLFVGFRPAQKEVPVFMYHCVVEELPEEVGDEELYVKPSEFEKQVAYWAENGYTGKFIEELSAEGGQAKEIAITFDDGYEDNYLYAFPILQKYQMKATIFMIAGRTGTPGYLTQEQMKEMADSGLVSIQSHTFSHPNLTTLKKEDLVFELQHSKELLEDYTGHTVSALAYPYGAYNDAVLEEAKKYYDYAAITFGSSTFRESSRMKVGRIGVYRTTQLDQIQWLTKKHS